MLCIELSRPKAATKQAYLTNKYYLFLGELYKDYLYSMNMGVCELNFRKLEKFSRYSISYESKSLYVFLSICIIFNYKYSDKVEVK